MTGIPESARQPAAPAQAAPIASPVTNQPAVPAPVANTPNTSGQYVNLFEAAAAQAQAPAPAPEGSDGTLDYLRSSPQFQQLRQLVQNQPHLLQPLLQQLGQSNPQLLQLISQNQDQFLNMLGADMSAAGEEFGDILGSGEQGEGTEAPGQYITITPEENEAINRVSF